jgi:SAM-dependent methyltransferase
VGFIDLFSDAAPLYAEARPTYPAALFEFVASLVPGRRRAWDCATGSGQAAGGLAVHFADVFATDASADQIAHAQPHPCVHYSVQLAEQTAFPTASFDLVSVATALHWLPFDRFFPEVHRVLRPGGVFAAWVYSRLSITQEIDDYLQGALLDVVRPYWAPENIISWDGYRGIPFPFEELPAPAFDIECHWSLAALLAFVRTWSGTRRALADRGPGFLDDVARGLASRWGDAHARKRVTLPLDMRIGRRLSDRG